MRRLRSPSLFWTFAGAFLAVLVAATVIQFLVIAGVVNPMMRRSAETRARSAALDIADQIATAIADSLPVNVHTLLRPYRRQLGPFVLAYLDTEGHIQADRGSRGMIARALRGADLPAPEFERRAPLDPPPGSPGSGGPPRLNIVARYPVTVDTVTYGEIIVASVERRFTLWPEILPWPVVLFLPVAVILSASAGLIMFRVFLRRLKGLERLAARVGEGDLSARVQDPSLDEIGRLGARLNRMAENLASAQKQIDDNDRQRRQLLADISHELATPLTSIRGYAETLLNPDVPISDQERETFLRDVLQEAERMDLLIQDLLELTRLEAGATPLTIERLDWTELCHNTVQRYLGRFRDAGLSLMWKSVSEPAWVEADGRRLEQVLENLLTNALRYVPRGGEVHVFVDSPRDRKPSVYRLTVSDTGPGFPPGDLPHVFDRFYQADLARSDEGTGLGLAIVREIVRRHGGNINAQNGPDGGAVIMIELPAL